MEVESLRSSSMTSWKFCQQKYFIEYGVLEKQEEKVKTIQGSITHHLLQNLAQYKLAVQNDQKSFIDDEIGHEFLLELCTPLSSLDVIFDYYQKKYPILTVKDKETCFQWFQNLLSMEKGHLNPLNQKIISPEQRFKFKLHEEWARLSDAQDDYLELTGTIDLIVESDLGPHILNLIDYKTGQCIDWGTGEVKTLKFLEKDLQLRFYHFAAFHLYPNVEDILVTIVYINPTVIYKKGKAKVTIPPASYTLAFGKEDLPKTKEMIRQYFEEIKDCKRPALNKSWRCASFCFDKNQSPHDPTKTVCNFYADQIYKIGLEKTLEKYRDNTKVGRYEGGGRSE